MDDVRGCFLGLPQGTTPAAVTTNNHIKMSFFKSSENIQKKEGGPDRSVSDNQSSSVIIECFLISQYTSAYLKKRKYI